jgi:integrase/recombinase XerD
MQHLVSDKDIVYTAKGGKDKRIFLTIPNGSLLCYDLTPYAKDIIASVWNNESEFLFTRGDRRPYTNKNLNHIWNEACRKSGIRIKLYNAFRHSLGCQLLEEGKDLSFVQEVLGHKTPAMTRRYAKRTAKKIAQVLSMRRKPCGTNAVQMTYDKDVK